MTNPMTIDQAYVTLRNALERIGIILNDPTPERARYCQELASSALAQTLLQTSKERTIIPHINDKDLMQVVKS